MKRQTFVIYQVVQATLHVHNSPPTRYIELCYSSMVVNSTSTVFSSFHFHLATVL